MGTKIPNARYVYSRGSLASGPQIGGHMDAVRKYHQLALDCLNLAEATRDPATQDQMLRLAEFCAKLADHSEDRISSGQPP
jgi:hypothetical protein